MVLLMLEAPPGAVFVALLMLNRLSRSSVASEPNGSVQSRAAATFRTLEGLGKKYTHIYIFIKAKP